MDVETTILFVLTIVSGFYMAWNIGANDVANAMGTSVGSHALTLRQAVMIAAVLEFTGAFFFGSHVSETVQKGIIDPLIFGDKPIILAYGMLASLLASGAWLQLASYYGWPVSTTHSIVGAIMGFGIVVGGVEAVRWDNISFIVSSWVVSPLLGGVIAFGIFRILLTQIFYLPRPVEAAKRLTPVIVFAVIAILSQMILYKKTDSSIGTISFVQSLGVSLALGAVGYVIGYFLVRNIQTENVTENIEEERYSPVVTIGIQKARKHLLRIKGSSQGEVLSRVTDILDELEHVAHKVQERSAAATQSKDYVVVEKIFGYLQIMSASLMAFAHGANDVANAIGPIAASVDVLKTGTISLTSTVPTWTLALGGVGIVFGLATWGWRVILTIGKKITELTPTRGFAAEFGAAVTILFASKLGMPISTTHTLVGAVVGVGMARGLDALNLRTVRAIVISWIVTVPAGAILTVIFYFAISSIFS